MSSANEFIADVTISSANFLVSLSAPLSVCLFSLFESFYRPLFSSISKFIRVLCSHASLLEFVSEVRPFVFVEADKSVDELCGQFPFHLPRTLLLSGCSLKQVSKQSI